MTSRDPFAYALLTVDNKWFGARKEKYTVAEIEEMEALVPDAAPITVLPLFAANAFVNEETSERLNCPVCLGSGHVEDGIVPTIAFGKGKLIVNAAQHKINGTGAVILQEALRTVTPGEVIPKIDVGGTLLIMTFPTYDQALAVSKAIAMPVEVKDHG